MHKQSSIERDVVRIQPAIFILSALLVPVLVTAFIMLYVFPQDVGADRFAWPVMPLMSSMMLGATYLGGAYFFLVVLLTREWRYVRLGFLPITAFAGSLGIATLLHWDRFVHERFAFQIWAFLYFTVPFILPVLWYRNRRLATGGNVEQERNLPLVIRWAFGVLGAVLTIAGMLLLLFPELMLATWPWTLTALTARVMSAMFLLPGLVGLSLAYVGSWSSARYLFQAQAFTIILMLIAVYVARSNFDWTRPVSWLFTAGLSGVLLLILFTYITMRERHISIQEPDTNRTT
jgi:hypothetical protein